MKGEFVKIDERVSIIIPVYINKKDIYDITIQCLFSIVKTVDPCDVEIIIVDDGSREQKYINLLKKIEKFSHIKIIHNDKNLGFAKTINNGIRESSNDLILLLNNDVFIRDGNWLKHMVDSMKKYDIAAPACGRLKRSNWTYIAGEAINNHQINDSNNIFYYPVGWCMMVRRYVFEEIGLIPEIFGQGFWEDSLFCYRAERAKFDMGIVDELWANQDGAKIQHLYHTTFKSENISLAAQYANNRKIFIDVIKNEKQKV